MSNIKKLTPFKYFALTNFPYIEADFDALTNYELFCKIVEYINSISSSQNEVIDAFNEFTESITSAWEEYSHDLTEEWETYKEYVDSIKDDLQGAVNTKLDEMAIDGSLETVIAPLMPDLINNWLDEHPEATTTVLDHSLSYEKFIVGTLGYVTPEMYGAIGNGVADDTNAFISCFANSNYVLLTNTYKITDNISISGNSRIIADKATINYTHPSNLNTNGLFTLDGNNIVWQGGTINGSGAINPYIDGNSVFYAHDKNNIILQDIKINNIPDLYGICLRHCENSEIKNCIITEYTYGGICLLNGCSNVLIDHNSVINGNDTEHLNRYPVSGSLYDSADNTTYYAENIVISNNFIKDDSPLWEGIDFHAGKNIYIVNNTIIGVVSGIVLTDAPTQSYSGYKAIVSGNHIELTLITSTSNVNNSGIVVGKWDDVNVTNNTIKNSGIYNTISTRTGSGIIAAISKNITISNNIFKNCNGQGAYFSSLYDAIISDNVFEGIGSTTIILFEIVGANNHIKIVNNIIHNFFRLISGSTTTFVTGDTRIYFKENTYYCDPDYSGSFSYSNVYGIIPDKLLNPALIAHIRTGEAGDFIYNGDPTNNTYPYIGWLCTVSGINGTDATWQAISL